MTNKDKTGNKRQSRRREREAKWLAENWDGKSWESLHTALMNNGGLVGERVLLPSSVPTQREPDRSNVTRKKRSGK